MTNDYAELAKPLTPAELDFVRRHEATVCRCGKAANHVSGNPPHPISEARFLATVAALQARIDAKRERRSDAEARTSMRVAMDADCPTEQQRAVRRATELEVAADQAFQIWSSDDAEHWRTAEIPYTRGFIDGAQWQAAKLSLTKADSE